MLVPPFAAVSAKPDDEAVPINVNELVVNNLHDDLAVSVVVAANE